MEANKLRVGNFIRHERYMDVAFLITKVLPSNKDYYVFDGYWIQQGFTHSTYLLDDAGNKIDQEVKIRKPELSSWFLLTNTVELTEVREANPCIRNMDWERVITLPC